MGMTKNQIKESISDFQQANSGEELYREGLREEIKKLESKLNDSYGKSIYSLVYKQEYGDFLDFVNIVAKGLRNLKS